MASEDSLMTNSALPDSPKDSGWDSIFSTVKAQVPSLDSDEASLSDCEDEELHIFQREDLCFTSDITADDLLEQAGAIQEETLPADFQIESWIEPERSTYTDLDINPTAKHESQQVTPDMDSEVAQPGPPEESPPENGIGSPKENESKQCTEMLISINDTFIKEKFNDTDTMDSGKAMNRDGTKFHQTEPIELSLQSIESEKQWDLEDLLWQLKEMGNGQLLHDTSPCSTTETELTAPPPIEYCSAQRQDRIMEQLVELSTRQSQGLADVPQLATEDRESSSCRTGLLQKEISLLDGRKQPEKSSTVYLDLRNPVLNLGTDEGPGKPAQMNTNAEGGLLNKSQLTGKTLLLRQLRETKSTPSTDFPNHNITQTAPDSDQQENMNTSLATQIQKKRRVKVMSAGAPKIQEEAEFYEKIVPEDREQEDRSFISPQPSPANIQEISCTELLEQKEKQEKEKRSRQRMQTQLEGLKPRNSVNGRQPMAEETPVLFHPEASYCPEVRTLPASSNGGAEMVLLTVWLSSCGQIIIPGQHSGRSPDTALSSANAYHTLVTWLLSLVPALTPQNRVDVPFHVLGLQQVWREEGLALYACLSPPDTRVISSPRIRKRKGKEDFRGTSSFYQHVSLFLTQNTLQSVAWWIKRVTHQLQEQLFPLHLEVPPVKLSNIVTLNSSAEAVEKAFSSASGFFWQTLETEEKLSPLTLETDTDNETEVVSVTLFDSLLKDPIAFHHALHLILMKGLDVCGLRLLYPEDTLLRTFIDTLPPSYTKKDVQTPPVMALALHGHCAGEAWGDIAGPSDPRLARLTDRHSLHALYGFSREEPILRSVRGSGRLMRDLSLWFGGRISNSGNVNIGIQNPPARSTDTCRPPALLTATIKGDVFLVVSPAVPPCAYGDVIDISIQRGFSLYGVRRVRLSSKRVAMLSMSPNQVSVFCPNTPSSQFPSHASPILHCLLLLFRKENAIHHVPGLIQGLMNGMAEQGVLGIIRKNLPYPGELNPSMCFHLVPYSDNLLQGLGGSLHAVPDPSTVTPDVLSKQPFTSDPELEQVVILTMSGRNTLKRAGHFLRQILRPFPEYQKSSLGSQAHRFELLGLKWLPCLSRLQAKEITPYEVGDRPWQASVERLTSNPALVCALRRVHAFTTMELTIQELTAITDKRQPQLIMSATPEIAFRQAALIFTDKEMISDPGSRCIMKYVAPTWITCKPGGEDGKRQTDSIFTYMLLGPPVLYTVLLLKPGTWSCALGKILRKIELQRFHIVGMKPVTLTPQDFSLIIPEDAKQDNALCSAHCDYLTSSPCLALCLRRHNSVLKLLDLLGPEDPELCKAQDEFLWRAQYGSSVVQNGMYGSTSYLTAIRDLKCFFAEGLPCDRSPVLETEQIPRLEQDVLFNSRAQRIAIKNNVPLSGPFTSVDKPFVSALCQTTCLLFPPSTLHGSPPPYINGLEKLIGRGFHVTAARLTVFNQSQAQVVTELYSPMDSLSSQFKALSEGPCLLVAAQRDNAVSCFTSLMDSVNSETSRDGNFTAGVMCPQTESQADKMISCFFDALTPDSIHQIVPQDS